MTDNGPHRSGPFQYKRCDINTAGEGNSIAVHIVWRLVCGCDPDGGWYFAEYFKIRWKAGKE